jgi:Pyruvate/2-oxoacid:ferredoxin oxidoreductase delta subunit
MGKYTVKASNINDANNNEGETTPTSSFEVQHNAAGTSWLSPRPYMSPKTYGTSNDVSWEKHGLVYDDEIIRILQTPMPTLQVSGIDLSSTSSIKSRGGMIGDKIDTPPNDNEIEELPKEPESEASLELDGLVFNNTDNAPQRNYVSAYNDILMKTGSLKHIYLNSAIEIRDNIVIFHANRSALLDNNQISILRMIFDSRRAQYTIDAISGSTVTELSEVKKCHTTLMTTPELNSSLVKALRSICYDIKESPNASSKIEIQQKAVYNCMSCPLYCSAKFIDEEIESFSIACQEQDGTEYVVANINEYSELFKSCPLRNKIIQIKLEK